MGLYDHWPYTNFHELNLSWLLRRMEDLSNVVENFVALNTIKYADPIQWNITTQYGPNTVVVDPQSGTAYISSRPVPAGVALTNTDYWSVIFTLDVISANKNITLRDDGSNVLATFSSVAGDWLLWNGTLYKVSQAINVNEAYVVGYNLDRYTVEMFIADYVDGIKNDIGDLTDLDTTDKDSIVNAINEIVSNVGDLTTLDTTDKDSIVDAINEIVNIVEQIPIRYVDVKKFGATGDGSTDDYAAISDAIQYAVANNIRYVYFPDGRYYCSNNTFSIDASKITLLGTGTSTLISEGLTSGAFITVISPLQNEQYTPRIPLMNICFEGKNYFQDQISYGGVIGVQMGTDATLMPTHIAFYNVVVSRFNTGLSLNTAYKTSYYNCTFIGNDTGVSIPSGGIHPAVPISFFGCYVECNNMGLLFRAGGYNSVNFFGGAFEYNRSVCSSQTNIVFNGVRFEFDDEASCLPDLSMRAQFSMINITGEATGNLKFENCFFLGLLGHFVGNAGYWFGATAYVNSNIPTTYHPFYLISNNAVTLYMINSNLVDEFIPTGTEYIAVDKYVARGNTTNQTSPIGAGGLVTETNGFITY